MKATKQGDLESEIRLAQLYLKGQGVPQNYVEARKLRLCLQDALKLLAEDDRS
jgi:TPR repeat protein